MANDKRALKWADTENNRGEALLLLGARLRDRDVIVQARNSIESVWSLMKTAGITKFDEHFKSRLADIDNALALLE